MVLNVFTLFLRFASLLLSFPKCFLSHWAKSPENKAQKNRLKLIKRFKLLLCFIYFKDITIYFNAQILF